MILIGSVSSKIVMQIHLVLVYLLFRKMWLNHRHGPNEADRTQPCKDFFVAFDLLSYISEKISILPLECLIRNLMLFTEKIKSIKNTHSSYLKVSL